ncbi:MAG: recombinase family protein [Deltaproteobacteria bacterium]|nr:recombinase family protein [Deltaproteobacteria bacterium]
MRKIAAYVRVSTKEAAKRKEGSLKAQVQRIKMRIEEKNRYNEGKWGSLVDIYKDEALSGKNTDRPEYQRMMADIAAGKIDTVIVTELSRLSRSVIDFLSFMNFLKGKNADFISLQQEIDTSDAIGKMIVTIMIALYEFEREQTVERIKNNYWARSLRGMLNGGSPFLGYDRVPDKPGTLTINQPEAETVRWLCDTYLKTGSLSKTVNQANDRGLTNKEWVTKDGKKRGGGTFSISSVHYILTNYAYIAKKIVNRQNKEKDPATLKEQERYLEIDAVWEPIIDKDTFAVVQAKLEKNKDGGRKPKNSDFYLTGVLYCDECGKPLVGKTGHGQNGLHFYYGHSQPQKCQCRVKNYPATKLEQLIRREITRLVEENGDVDAFIEKLQESLRRGTKNIDSLLGSIKRQLEEIDMRKRNIIAVISANSDAAQSSTLISELKNLEEKAVTLEEKREELKIQRLQVSANEADREYVVQQIKQFQGKAFDRADAQEKKDVLRNIVKSIHIHPENVIRLDLWATEHHPKRGERSKPTEPGAIGSGQMADGCLAPSLAREGVILPFQQPENGADSSEVEGWEDEVGSSLGLRKNRGGPI